MFSQISKQIDAYLMARDLDEDQYELETTIKIKDYKKLIEFKYDKNFIKINLQLNESYYKSLIRRLKYFKTKRDKDNFIKVKDIYRKFGNHHTFEFYFKNNKDFEEFYKKYIAGGTEIDEKRKKQN